MIKGFSLLEVCVALTVTMVVLSIVIAGVTDSTRYAQKIADNQQVLESVFFTVDTVKSDLTKCGMRLQEAARQFDISLFKYTDTSFQLRFGVASEFLEQAAAKGEKTVEITPNDYLKKKRKVLLYDMAHDCWEFNHVSRVEGDLLTLTGRLKNDYSRDTRVVVIKEVAYKLYAGDRVIKRKVDKGHFQPLISNVSDFYVTFFPESNSLLYRIEINNREQVRGYIFMSNMVNR